MSAEFACWDNQNIWKSCLLNKPISGNSIYITKNILKSGHTYFKTICINNTDKISDNYFKNAKIEYHDICVGHGAIAPDVRKTLILFS